MASLPMKCHQCNDTFSVIKPPISLPCNHALCKICTCQLEMKMNKHCPQCKKGWTENLIEPNYTAFVKMLTAKKESNEPERGKEEYQDDPDPDLIKEIVPVKEEQLQVLCKDHGEEVCFYCFTCEEQLCIECVSLKHKPHDFCPTKKSGHRLKNTIGKALNEAIGGSKIEVKAVRENLAVVNSVKHKVQNLEQEVVRVKNIQKNNQKKLLAQKELIASRFTQLADVGNLLKSLPGKVNPQLIEELEQKVKYLPEQTAETDEEENCIIAIASAYMNAKPKNEELSTRSFLKQMMSECASQSWMDQLKQEGLQEIFDRTFKLNEGQRWTVKNTNDARAAALTIPTRHPKVILVLKEDDSNVELMPCKIVVYFGCLDGVSVPRLPDTVYGLGLPIRNSEESKVVSQLKRWQGLQKLNVAVSCSLSPASLSPLPNDMPFLFIHFYKANDEELQNIRPIIDALLPPKRHLSALFFPKCQFSSSGLQRLPRLLQGLSIGYIQFSHVSGLTVEQKEATKRAFMQTNPRLGSVSWDMEWLYLD